MSELYFYTKWGLIGFAIGYPIGYAIGTYLL